MNALGLTGFPESDAAGSSPLSRSSGLLDISDQAATLARLYGRGPLHRTINNTAWQFRWCYISTPLTGVELRLRIASAEIAVLVEDLGPFGSAVDVIRTELPAALRAAYLAGLGDSLWRELEILTERTVEVLDVDPNCTMGLNPDCVGFEIGDEARGVSVRGFLRPIHAEVPEVLLKVSRREMPPAPVPRDLRIRWSAVVGSTALPASEVRALEEQDIVIIDDATYAADGLMCWLGAGSARHHAGRVMLRRDKQLQMVEFSTKGRVTMNNVDADTTSPEPIGCDDIPVSLRFELVRWEAPLTEVASLAAGSVIDLGQRIDEQAVTVWVEQRCVGKGQLVAIGERLGVRLLSIFAQGT